MTTRNLVPRGDSQGKIGISTLKWEEINSVTLKVANLQNNDGNLLLKKGPGIEDITLDSSQLKIALDDTFLTSLGFNADGTQPTFTLPDGNVLPGNTVIAAGDSLVAAIQKLNDDLRDVSAPTNLTVGSFLATSVLVAGEAFVDDDTQFMTSGAINDRIETLVNAVTLTVDAGDGSSTQNVDISADDLQILGGTGLTSTISKNANDVTVTVNIDNTAVSTGEYGSATETPTFTVDQQGRITAASEQSIAITSSQVTNFEEAVEDTVAAQFAVGTHTGISVTYTDDGGGSDGALSIAITDDGVTAAKLNANVISGHDALAAGLESTDEFLVSDNGIVKRMDVSVLESYLNTNLNFTNNTDIDVTKANLLTRLASFDGSDTVNIGDGDNDTEVVIRGNLSVLGATSTISSTTITVDDKNIELGSVDTPSDTTADGGGITLKGSTDKTISWENDNDAWEFSEHVVLANLKEFKIDNGAGAPVSVISATTLGSGVINSSLTSVGTLGILNVDNIRIDGNTISSTAGADLNITPLADQQIVLDGTVIIDEGVITGVTSITSTTFEGDLTGDVTGNSSTTTKLAATKTIGMTGDVAWTSAAFDGSGNVTGTSTIQANAVESTMLNDNIVSGLDDIDAALAITDALIVSDAGTIKRTDLSRLSTMLVGTGLADSSGTLNLNIDSLAALGGTGLHQTQDHFLFSDSGTEKKITFSNLEDAIFSNITTAAGDVVIAAGGAATISAGVVDYAMISPDAIKNEDDMGSDSASHLATQQSIKAYVDSQVTAQDLDITSDNGTIDIDLDSETLTIEGGTGIDSSASGTTVSLTIDSTVTTLAAAQTLTNKTLTSPVLNTGVSGTAIKDEDNMGSDSDTHLATQQSIKAYVDAQVTAQDLDFQGDSGGALLIDLDSETLTIAGGTGIDTIGNGNTITAAIDSTVATLLGAQTLASKTLTSPVLNTGVSGTAVLDEDNMASDSATQLATQQSIKAYVDAQVTAQDLDIASDAGTIDIDLDSETLTISGGTGLASTAGGTTVTLAIDATVATLTGAQTLTNKGIDADTNTITNIEVDNFKASVIVTEAEEIANNDNDTTLPTSAAVKDYVDEQIGRHGGMFKTDTVNNSLGADVQYNRDVIFDSSPLVRSHFGPFAYDLGQLITDPWPGGSDLIFYGSQTVQSSDRHFLVIGSGATKGNCKFTGATYIDGGEQTP